MAARRAARVDSNQREIIAGLRAVGATVQPLHTVGQGCPDLAVGYHGQTYLLELKTREGRLTPDERLWHVDWRGHVAVVRTLEEALQVIGAIEKQEREGKGA